VEVVVLAAEMIDECESLGFRALQNQIAFF